MVTANKALLAEDGPTLFEAAEKAGRDLYYEAAVAGAIPILRPLRESLAGDRVTRVLGIVNGTTNFILDKMDTTGAGFAEALEEAQDARLRRGRPDRRRRGLRRRRQGRDPGQPGLPHPGHRRRRLPRGHHRGHRRRRRVGRARWAASSSCSRSASCATADGDGVSVRVHPAMIPRSHPLASVREAFNAVFVESEAAGQLMFYGPGAGGAPTAQRGARRPGHGRPQPARRRRAAPASRRTPTARCCRWARPSPATTSPSTSTTAPACWPRSRPRSPSTTSRSRPCARRAAAPTPSSSSSPTGATDAAAQPRPSSDLRALDIVREVTSVMRVEGMDRAMTGPPVARA